MNVGTEGLGLWEGIDRRDKALAQSKQGREDRILAVRTVLLAWAEVLRQGGKPPEVTADDAMRAAESLGYGDGDHRWLANIFVRWDRARNTGRYVPSAIPRRKARPIPVWVMV